MTSDPRQHGVRLFVLLAALTAFGPLSLDLYLPAFPQIADQFGVDTGHVQLTFSAALIGLGLGQLLWGPVSDRFGRKRPMAAGISVFVVASLLIVVAPNLEVMVALRLVQALGGAAGIVIGRAVVRDLFSGQELARAMAAIITVFTLAPVLAPIVGYAIVEVAPWEWAFVALSAFGLACLGAAAALPETLPPEARSRHGVGGAMRVYARLAGSADFRLPATVAALGGVALFAYLSESPAVFMDSYGASRGGFTVLFALLASMFGVGAQINRRLLADHPARALLRTSVTVQAIAGGLALTAAVVQAPLVWLMLPLGLALMTVAAVNGNALALALDPFPGSAASAAALAGGLQQLISGLAAALFSALAFRPPVELGGGMVAAALLSLAVLVADSRRRRRRASMPA